MTDFFRKYMGMIYGVSLKYLKDEEKSKDAVMDIYEKLVIKLLKHDVTNPKSWLYTLTKNHCYEILRSKKRVMEKENAASLMYSEEVYRLTSGEEKEEEIRMLEDCVEALEIQQQKSGNLKNCMEKKYESIREK